MEKRNINVSPERINIAFSHLKSFFRNLEKNGMISEKSIKIVMADLFALEKMLKGEYEEKKSDNTPKPIK